MTPSFVRLAAVFYGFLIVVAVLWSRLRDRGLDFLGDSVFLGVALGLLTAAVTISLGMVAYRLLPVMRRISSELAPRLVDDARRSDLVLVSIFSGVGEEALFRGAIQPEFGIVAASLIFGLVHIGPDRRYLLWTLWAVLAGFLFGALFIATGGLLAPMLAHVAHNAATLLLWKRFRSLKGDLEG